MKKNIYKKGFTLIEILLYIGLFSLLLGTAFIAAFQLIDGSSKLGVINTTEEEGNFVIRKIEWALSGAKNFSIPSSSELIVAKYDGSSTDIKLDSASSKILIKESGSFFPITTGNVQVTSLNFQQVGTSPVGINATAKIKTINTNPVDFTTIKYIRK